MIDDRHMFLTFKDYVCYVRERESVRMWERELDSKMVIAFVLWFHGIGHQLVFEPSFFSDGASVCMWVVFDVSI